MITRVNLMIVENEKQFTELFSPSDNIWWIMGMSYMDEYEYLRNKGLLKESYEIVPEGVNYILDKIENHPVVEQRMKEFHQRHSDELSGEYNVWRKVWILKHREMIRFWKEAKRIGSNVYMRIGRY